MDSWPPAPLPTPPLDLDPSLVLRPWSLADAPALAEAWDDPDVTKWLDPPTGGVARAEAWIAGEVDRREKSLALDLAIDVDGTVAGEVGLWAFDAERRAAQVGYWIAGPFRGRRLGATALKLTTSWFVEVAGAEVIVASCHPENRSSHRTAELAGYSLIGHSDAGERVYVSSV